MESNPFIIYVMRWVTMAAFLLHAFRGIALAYANRQARGAVGYQVTATNNSTFSARNMAWIGSWIFVFWGFHLYSFWWHLVKGDAPEKIVVNIGEERTLDVKNGAATIELPNGMSFQGKVEGDKLMVQVPAQSAEQPAQVQPLVIEERFADVYIMVAEAFKNPLISIFYLISMLILAFHLWHGFSSAFQTFGLTHKKYTPFITWAGRIYSVLVPLAFAAMPLYFWLFK
jgi:succinate dehydrogenase / fumarate reductase, cytochrome b subunit